MNPPRLLVFNLMIDADDPILGFTTVWLNALAKRCSALDVITMQAGRLDVAPNVQVYSVGKERGYSEPRRALEFYRLLFGLLRRNRYDACFAHMMPLFAVMGAPLLRLSSVPITLWYAHKSVPPLLRLAEKVVRQVVTASPESFRLPSAKLQVIGHGVDTGLFVPAHQQRSDCPFTIITVGRIAPVKHLEIMIQAVKLLAEQHTLPQIRLRLVGQAYPQDSGYAAELRALVTANRLETIVEFPGAVPYHQVIRVYQEADVMVNLSATGSVDKAVLEAMACGLPVITCNEAFQPLLAPWGERLLIAPDSPAALAGRLEAIAVMLPEERAALGAQLRTLVVEQHSLERLVATLLPILTSPRPNEKKD